MAQEHDPMPAKASLVWLHSHENAAEIPKASSPNPMIQNLAAAAIELTDGEDPRVDAIDRRHRVTDFDHGPWN